MKAKIKVWLEKDGKQLLGEGRIRLLETVDKKGSLKKAVEELGYSYRYAWGIIRKLEKRIGEKLIISHKGGAHGGDSHLTEYGKKVIRKFKKYKEEIKRENNKIFRRYFKDDEL
ncbi:MAG: LysR family transcriptional regulator [Candidatus Mcinerneyibacterium aminivorans]|uniref:LysR family transcriptional regulator n=1 Tax=Candidatus Mcinerneyibacterium aminivorans TaxID=2703815 RepID=A0A5D0MK51_9BACT|nr:MAG: LysR family transcriptional regulator [Candidatus Mcinerneyibacterium aminivorans]